MMNTRDFRIAADDFRNALSRLSAEFEEGMQHAEIAMKDRREPFVERAGMAGDCLAWVPRRINDMLIAYNRLRASIDMPSLPGGPGAIKGRGKRQRRSPNVA